MSYIGNTNSENWLTPREEFFSGDGTTTSFSLTRKIYSLSDIVVSVNNVPQNRIDSYNYNYTTNSIEFNEAPLPGGNNIAIRYNARQVNLVVPAQGTITGDALGLGAPTWTDNGDLTISGDTDVEGNLAVTGTITGTSLSGNGSAITNIAAGNIASGTVPVARLGSGSDTSTKFLRGDSTWQSVVTSFSAGSIGFTPSTSSTGAVTLSGTLATGYGGTGLTSFTSGGAVYASSTSALTTGTLPVSAGGTGATSFTANNLLVGNGTGTFARIAPGSSGNILISNGTAWTSANSLTIGVGIRGPRQQIFTSSGTFTVPAGVDSLKVTVIGGGGGYINSADLLYASSGGDGGISTKFITGVSSGQTIVATVGAKGASVTASSGAAGTGGTSSFGSYCTATGGSGGYYDYWSVAQDGFPGLGTTGDFNMSGYRYNQIGARTYYGQGAIYGVTVPNGLILVEY